jgi:3-phosphoshikimate 1-carboxyvinyltransferase
MSEIRIHVPASKSLTQRALLIGALACGRSCIRNPLRCQDSEVLSSALKQMGVGLTWHADEDWVEIEGLKGNQGFLPPSQYLGLRNAGTAMRFLATTALLCRNPLRLDGNAAMRRRPMPGLLDALLALGVKWRTAKRNFCPPVELEPPPLQADKWRERKRVALDARGSSQQLSALLMIGPKTGAGLEVALQSALPSQPYVDLTMEVMRTFGARVEVADGCYTVFSGGYRATDYVVEGDHSSASYVWAASRLQKRPVDIENLRADSSQGDRVFPEILDRLDEDGGQRPVELHLGDTPDVAPTAAVYALFRQGPTVLRGIKHLSHKECDRIAVLAREVNKLGVESARRRDLTCEPPNPTRVEILSDSDGWRIRPGPLSGPAMLDAHGDHRMAMCFGLLGLQVDGIRIKDPHCVDKSYPEFWQMIEQFR